MLLLIIKMNLTNIAKEIRDIITIKQKELKLTFDEDEHKYTIQLLNSDKLTTSFPSVTTLIKRYYVEFPKMEKSLQMCNGDLDKQRQLLLEWQASADYANNIGSRTHYELEKYHLKFNNFIKEVRKPIFECNEIQTNISENMIYAGKEFLDLMLTRNAILLDTEMVLGCNILKYTGQPDTVWLILSKSGELGFIITDYKTNKPKNFEIHSYTKQMLKPFEQYPDTALSHYYLQLPFYGRLLLSMLKGSKYNDIKFLGGVIVHLKENRTFKEYKIPTDILKKVNEIII
jgi:hypothetical protein